MASILWVPVIFTLGSFYLYYLSINLPSLSPSEDQNALDKLKFPTSMEELRSLAALLNHYRKDHWSYVMLLFASAYFYKQTFAIPGSVFLNLLAGSLFGSMWGLVITCVLTACGATCCFLLSYNFGRKYVVQYFPDKVNKMQKKVEENMDGLFFFLLFLRLFPMSPNWFMNIAAPILNIPIHLFFMSVLIGLIPYNFICVQTGSILSQISSTEDIFTVWTLLQLSSIAMMALIPGFFMRKNQEKRKMSNKS